ncbi:uncharacterized protein LOC112652600 isoform X4 [Canis lupus dingo]|uniref:uncharacterized protein LOC112652600 isoform X4 n=1 Tax=Canis lupus dingo TaxID=286419 RepID=UPI0020C26D59|nr:uncharacterized protein LOC112652600 isoform X4 [Canis lupus dingo]XP_048963623.1 uncharacterized protein LOC112652600 isoform X4 [Canis lupus dingo]
MLTTEPPRKQPTDEDDTLTSMFLSQAQGEWNIQQRTLPAGPCCEMTVGKKSPVVFSAGKGSLLLILEDCETHLEDSLASDVMDTVDGEELDVYFHGVSGALELLRWTPRLSKVTWSFIYFGSSPTWGCQSNETFVTQCKIDHEIPAHQMWLTSCSLSTSRRLGLPAVSTAPSEKMV